MNNARTARTPFLRLLQRAIRDAGSALSTQDRPQAGTGLEHGISRREFLRKGMVGAAALSAGGLLLSNTGCSKQPGGLFAGTPIDSGLASLSGLAPRVAIIGAGIAGLNCAYKLKKAGIKATVYEGSSRVGGRVRTVVGALADGLTTEFGAEFIDSNHKELLALAHEFQLPVTDRYQAQQPKVETNCFYFDGVWYSTRQLLDQLAPIAARILADQASLPSVIDFQHPGNAHRFDTMTVAEYLDRLGVTGWVRRFMDVSYISEYGADPSEQSALNVITLVAKSDLEHNLYVFGDSDERYHILGGNQRVTDELAKRIDGQMHLGQRLEAIQSAGNAYRLTFAGQGGSTDVEADLVVLCLPFSTLRDVAIRVDLPASKKNAIQNLGYGTGSKVMLGFNRPVWRDHGYEGTLFTDIGIQVGWDSSEFQNHQSAGYTVFAGGAAGTQMGQGTPEEQGRKHLQMLEKCFPGATAAHNGRVARAHWASEPLIKGSYSFYKPGQWTSVAGAQGVTVGNLYFAGEHCSMEFQGYINGGAETGMQTAKSIVAKLGKRRAA